MGHVKNFMIEQEAQYAKGYISPKAKKIYICANHFNNPYLVKYINELSYEGVCTYCGKSTYVLDFSDFMDHVGERITNYLGPIDNEDLFLASSFRDKDDVDEEIPGLTVRGSYIVPTDAEYYEDEYEMMEDFDLITDNDELNKDIANSFNVDQWIRKNPTALLPQDEMMFSWKNFSEMVKKKQRYTFFRSDNYYKGVTDTPGLEVDIIAEVSDSVRLLGDIIKEGTLLYRGRPEDDKAPFTTFKSLTAPPATYSKANRMSPYGISMFYGSFERETSLSEIRNYLENKSKKIYIGIFKTTKPLRVINLCKIPEPNFWMKGEDDWKKVAFLHMFHEEISKPIVKENSELEYIPSQIFSEYLRYIQKTDDNQHYDGIVYESSLTKSKNIVLFYDNKTSEDILELVGGI